MSEVAGGFRFLPLGLAVAFAAVAFAQFLLLRRVLSWRLARSASREGEPGWVEKARLSFRLRAQLTSLTLLLTVFSTWVGVFATGTLSAFPPWFVASLSFVLTFTACHRGARGIGRVLGLRPFGVLEFVFWLRSGLMAIGIFAGGTLVVFGAKEDDPALFGFGAVAVGVGFALPPLLFWLCAKRRDDLASAWEPLFQRLVKPKAVYEIRTNAANAFASPLGRTIAVTSRLLEELSPPEVESIVAHELGHLREGKKAFFRLVPLGSGLVVLFGGAFFLPIWGTLGLLLGVLFLTSFVVRKLAVRFEEHADASAREESEPEVFARALLRIHELGLIPAVLPGSTHPSLYDRLEASGVAPGFPRPGPPARGLSTLAFFPMVLALGCIVLSPFILRVVAAPTEALEAKAALGRDEWALAELGRRELLGGRKEGALELYRAAYREAPENPWYSLNLSRALAHLNRCGEAGRFYLEARARSRELPTPDAEVESELAIPFACAPGLPTDDHVPASL